MIRQLTEYETQQVSESPGLTHKYSCLSSHVFISIYRLEACGHKLNVQTCEQCILMYFCLCFTVGTFTVTRLPEIWLLSQRPKNTL